jgi:four helix bundle protein
METTIKHAAKKQFKTFRDLGTWQSANDLAVAVQRQCDLFTQPGQAIAYQLSRAAVNVCTNIAKGFGQWDYLEKEASYAAASNALTEVENLLAVAQGTGYISMPKHDDLLRRTTNTFWMLVKLRKINQEWGKNQG